MGEIIEKKWNLCGYMYSRIRYWHKPAYILHNDPISYKTIKEKSQGLAKTFQNEGIKPLDRVLLFLNDTPSFTISFLAAIQIGAIPIPLNPRSKISSITHYLNDSEATLVIGEPETICEIQKHKDVILGSFKKIIQDIYREAEDDLHQFDLLSSKARSLSTCVNNKPLKIFHQVGLNDTVFWQYTSGTTGDPKAVMHHGQGIMFLASSYASKKLSCSVDDVFYSTAKFFFGYGLGNSLFFPFYYNATAILDDRWPTPEIVCDNICSYKPSRIFSVPAIYNALLDNAEQISLSISEGTRFISAGSPLPSILFNAWKYHHDILILDGVGTTEMGHIYITNTQENAKAGSLYGAVPGYEIKLVDTDGNDTNCNRGEMYVKGPSMFQGYHGLPEKNSGKFQNGWYKTGDIFNKNRDNSYSYEGREDDLFKVKGRWVSPLDIESFVLSNFCNVKETILVPSLNIEGENISILFLVVHENIKDINVLQKDINALIFEGFESHCLPTGYYVLPKLPKNDNGKVLRNLLADQIKNELDKEKMFSNYVKKDKTECSLNAS
jgi:acyl-coenzyme A synthetase/AMP-(fatty) acid ligase